MVKAIHILVVKESIKEEKTFSVKKINQDFYLKDSGKISNRKAQAGAKTI